MLQAVDSFYQDLARELDPHGTLQAGDYVPVVETKRPDGYIDLELHSPYGGTPLEFSLQPKQAIAWESDAEEMLFGGAAGPGKSYFLRVLSIAYCVMVPGVQVYLFRRLSPDLHKNHMQGPTSYPEMLAPWISGGQAQIIWSGAGMIKIGSSRIHLCHCQRESSLREKYYGPEMHLLMIDELTTFTEPMYKFLRGRLRHVGLEVPDGVVLPRVVTASNPGNIGHNFVKKTFIDPVPPFEIHRAERSDGGMLRQFIPALLEDNPALQEADPRYEDRLEGVGPAALVQALRYGSWDIEAGGMFDDLFDRDIHVIEPFEIPSSWYIDRSFDWGSTSPFSTGWWAESDGTEATMRDGSKRKWPKGTLFRIQEDYGWNGDENQGLKLVSSEIARRIIEREENFPWGKRVRPGPADPAIYTRTDGRCTADDMEQVGVRWVEGDASPGSRKTGAEALRTRLKAAIPPDDPRPGWMPEDPAIYIFSHCRQWIRTVPTLPRDEKDDEKVSKNSEDHIFDDTKYRCLHKRMVTSASYLR